MSARCHTRRWEMFWSNSSFIRRQRREPSLAVCGEGQTRLDVFGGQVGEICENLLLRHPAGEIFQYVGDGHAHAADAGFAAALAGLDGDDLAVVHAWMIAERAGRSTV